jgi:nucleotide-binding universal stress UspA family protein
VLEIRTHLPPGAVVVGVDGSSHAREALLWASDLAARDERPLVVATAVPVAHALTPEERDQARGLARVQARRIVGQAALRARNRHPDLVVRTLVRFGSAGPMLIRLGEQAHLLVVGRRGLGRLASVLLGSVSVQVASRATCPVVVVHRSRSTAQGRVVVAVGGHESIRQAVDFAFAEADARHAELTVLHCGWTPDEESHRVPAGADLGEDWAEEEVRLSTAMAGLRERHPDVEVHWELCGGPDVARILDAARSADLLVLGLHPHRTALGALTGSTLGQLVLEKAECAVAVVPSHQRSAGTAVPSA